MALRSALSARGASVPTHRVERRFKLGRHVLREAIDLRLFELDRYSDCVCRHKSSPLGLQPRPGRNERRSRLLIEDPVGRVCQIDPLSEASICPRHPRRCVGGSRRGSQTSTGAIGDRDVQSGVVHLRGLGCEDDVSASARDKEKSRYVRVRREHWRSVINFEISYAKAQVVAFQRVVVARMVGYHSLFTWVTVRKPVEINPGAFVSG